MALHKVTVSFDMVVVSADNDTDELEWKARKLIKDAVSDTSLSEYRLEISDYKDDVEGWDDECLPYGGDGTTRIGEYK